MSGQLGRSVEVDTSVGGGGRVRASESSPYVYLAHTRQIDSSSVVITQSEESHQ